MLPLHVYFVLAALTLAMLLCINHSSKSEAVIWHLERMFKNQSIAVRDNFRRLVINDLLVFPIATKTVMNLVNNGFKEVFNKARFVGLYIMPPALIAFAVFTVKQYNPALVTKVAVAGFAVYGVSFFVLALVYMFSMKLPFKLVDEPKKLRDAALIWCGFEKYEMGKGIVLPSTYPVRSGPLFDVILPSGPELNVRLADMNIKSALLLRMETGVYVALYPDVDYPTLPFFIEKTSTGDVVITTEQPKYPMYFLISNFITHVSKEVVLKREEYTAL